MLVRVKMFLLVVMVMMLFGVDVVDERDDVGARHGEINGM